jgi:photosystem II stability/assembly factor-like uncharacterized protein
MPYKKLKLYFILPTISVLCFFSCQKKSNEIVLTTVQSNTDNDLKAICIQDETRISIVGGDQWTYGIWLQSENGGTTFTKKDGEKKALNAIVFSPDGAQYSVGTNGVLIRKTTNTDTIGPCMYPLYNILHSVAIRNDSVCFMTGGEGFQAGSIVKYIHRGYWNRDGPSVLFPQELRDITYVNDSTLVAVGYGLVLHSSDSGKTWETLPVKNDFFFSVHFPTDLIGYIVGYHGSILKSVDAGATWTTLRNGDKLTVSDEPFRRVFFRDENTGYIVGDKGLFWKTTDGGSHWQTIETNSNKTFFDVKVTTKGLGFIAGKSGIILRFQD